MNYMRESMYCAEKQDAEAEDQLIQVCLVKDGVFRRIENALARAVKGEHEEVLAGSLNKRQKRRIKELFEIYRYMVVSFGESYEGTQQMVQKELFKKTVEMLATAEVEERLKNKFGLFF